MVKKILALILIMVTFLSPGKVFADDFKGIDIKVNIDENGIGHIEEIWNINEDKKSYTERYKAIKNLRGLTIEDFSVSAFGKEFEKLEPWDSDLSFEEKSEKYGIIEKGDDSLELCWGISRYDDNSYKLSYKISPLVIGLNDSDMVFFQFVGDEFDPKPERVNISIDGYKPFDNVKFWGFGLEGDIKKDNGKIILASDGDVNYTTVMMKFPKGTFNSSYREDKTFNDYAEKAVKDSDWEAKEGTAYKPPLSLLAKSIIGLVMFFGLGSIFVIVRASALSFNEKNIVNYDELKDYRDFAGKYYKDIPYDGHIEDIGLFIEEAEISSVYVAEAYINAFLIKWALDKNIGLRDKKTGFLEQEEIEILKEPSDMGVMEEKLFNILKETSKFSGSSLITESDFKNYLEENEDDLDNFYEDFLDNSIDILKEKGYLEDYEYEKKFLNSRQRGKELRVTDKGIGLYERIIMFKNYLQDYEDVKNDDPYEIIKYKDFLIYSAIFDVDEEFVDMMRPYPYFATNYMYNPYLFHNSRSFARSINNTYADVTGFNSNGSGGSTSISGGGGSFGGGGGGGR